MLQAPLAHQPLSRHDPTYHPPIKHHPIGRGNAGEGNLRLMGRETVWRLAAPIAGGLGRVELDGLGEK